MDQAMETFNGDLLPKEIIIQILEYLPLIDIKNASLTSTKWYAASLHSTIMNKRTLIIENDRTKNSYNAEYTQVMNSTLPYNKMEIKNSPLCLKNCEFWKKINGSLKHIKMKVSDNLFDCLKELTNLKSLELKLADKEFVVENWNHQDQIVLSELEDLCLTTAENLGCVPYLLGMAPELVHLDLRFLNSLEVNFILITNICEYLHAGKKRIKSLRIQANDITWEHIFKLKGMNLELFSFNRNHPGLILDFKNFTDPLKLLHLNIINLCIDMNTDITIISKTMPNLETLIFSGHGYRNLTEVKNLKKLKNICLTYIQISIFFSPPNDFGEIFPESLEHLYLWSARLNTFGHLSNLTFLCCVRCKINSNDILQAMFENLKKLKHLQIFENLSIGITDFGFTGMLNGEQIGHSISGLRYLETLYIHMRGSNLSNKTLLHIAQLNQLKSLDIEMDIVYPTMSAKEYFPYLAFLEHFELILDDDCHDEYYMDSDYIENINGFIDSSKIPLIFYQLMDFSGDRFEEEKLFKEEDEEDIYDIDDIDDIDDNYYNDSDENDWL